MAPVLLISYSGAIGGAERILLDFVAPPRGEWVLACPEGPLAERARALGIPVMRLRRRSLAMRGSLGTGAQAVHHLAGHRLEVQRLIGDLDPSLVVAWGMRSAIACLAVRPPGVPVAFQHNDLLPGQPVAGMVRRAAARAAMVLALSRTIAADLDPGSALHERLQVIHPGVDAGRFDGLRSAADPPEVLLLGALVDWKRPDLALEACAQARQRVPGLRLRIVGSPLDGGGDELVAALRARAQAPDLAGAVEFVGTVADPEPELERACCLLHCAPREPFGLAVVEALAAGRPAVVAAAGGTAEIVESSCGRLYPPGKAADAAAALAEIVSDGELRADLGTAGRARVARCFSLPEQRAQWARAISGAVRRDPPPTLDSAELAVVTVTHNSAPELRRLLDSVRHHLPRAPVVVVDSGSEDDSLSVASEAALTEVIDMGSNVGFGAGCNAGVASVAQPAIALLNPDVELLDDSLLRLAEAALDPSAPARLLAPLVLYPDGSRQDSVHPLPTSSADLARALVPPAALPRPLALPLAPWRSQKPRPVGWAVGCALLARTQTLKDLGPFDERIFLYGEDLELGVRAATRGVETWFWPQARVVHHRAHTTVRAFSGEPFRRLAETRRAAIARGLGVRRAWIDDGAQALTFLSRGAAKRMLGRPALRERRQLTALAGLPR